MQIKKQEIEKPILKRCQWCSSDSLYHSYHDNEWGVPLHHERSLFEFLLLEGAQAGLSWITVLKKREHYRRVFDNFNAELIASYDTKKIDSLLTDPGIIRNRLKVKAFINNAHSYLSMQESGMTLNDYFWGFVDGKTIQNHWKSHNDIPAYTTLSENISKDLKQRGFTFVGPTIIYAFMQATGMVNDHTLDCFRHTELFQA